MAYKAGKVELELAEFIDSRDSSLEQANQRLVYGDGVFPGTLVLRSFYAGDQWNDNEKIGGGAKRTFNYCRQVVENNTAFLANEPPEVSIQSKKADDPIENGRSEQIAKILSEIHVHNDLPFQFMKMVKVAGITGVFFLFGPIWNDELKLPTYQVFENPENIRPIWRDSNFSQMIGFVNRYRLDEKTFKTTYKRQMKERGINPDSIQGSKIYNAAGPTNGPFHDFKGTLYDMPMVDIQEYYDDQYYMMRVGNGKTKNITIEFKEHRYGFIPGQYLPNVYDPSSGRGTSDIEDVLEAQMSYNEAKSNVEDIIAQTAYSQLYGTNLDNFGYIKTPEHGTIINLPENATINALPRSGTTFQVESYVRSVQEDMINLSGQNQVTFPGGSQQVLSASGRSLSVMMQPINNKVALKKLIFKMALEKLNRNILILLSQKDKIAKDIINENYNIQVFLSSVLTRDVTEEINKFNSKIQSLTTTQKNLGIPSPSEEQKMMIEELQSPIIGTEIARQPMIIQQETAMQNQQPMGQGNPQPPMLSTEGAGPQPIATAGQGAPSAMSPEGSIRQKIQQAIGAKTLKGQQ